MSRTLHAMPPTAVVPLTEAQTNSEKNACTSQQFFHSKVIGACQSHQLCVIHRHFIQSVLKLSIFVVLENDTALVELRQNSGKLLIQFLYDLI